MHCIDYNLAGDLAMVTLFMTFYPDTCSYNKVEVFENGTDVVLEDGIPCESWDYDQSLFTKTIMSEV